MQISWKLSVLLKNSKTDWQDPKAIRRAVIDLLARREHSRFEIQQKLRKKGVSVSVLNPILDELVDENLLSDERFTESYIHHRASQGYGPVRIRLELQERGVTAVLIEQLLDESATSWFELAAEVYKKKYGNEKTPDLAAQAKQQRFLLYRGFTFEQIKHVG